MSLAAGLDCETNAVRESDRVVIFRDHPAAAASPVGELFSPNFMRLEVLRNLPAMREKFAWMSAQDNFSVGQLRAISTTSQDASTPPGGGVSDWRPIAMSGLTRLVVKCKRQTEVVPDELLAAVGDAITFVAALPEQGSLPIIGMSEDGEISLLWRGDAGRKALVTFEGDGSYGYALHREGRYVPGATDVEHAGEVPADLENYVRALA